MDGDVPRETSATDGELRPMLALALPVVLVQVGLMLMGVMDTLMVGHVSAQVLASVALGNLYWFNATILAQGTLMALDPLVAQAVGARDDAGVSRALQRGFVLALVLSVFTALLLLPVRQVFIATRQQPAVIGDATSYILIAIPGVLPYLMFAVLRQTMQALHRVAPIVWTIVGANLANVVLNWIFIYGHLGSPALGAAGSAIATLISRWLMGLALLALSWPTLRPYIRPFRRESFRLAPLRRMLALGLPIGAQQLLESSAFGAIGLLMGMLGTIEIAAHQIAITLAALTFMVPLGVGAAASVRVGYAIGARDLQRARRAARAALSCGVGFMAFTALVFLLLPAPLARLFTEDTEAVRVAILLIPVAGVFQVFDGAQAVGAGVLRGIGDTRAPLIAMLAGYWVIGLPVSVFLGFRTDLRATGLWWGFVFSLGAVAMFLFIRMRVLFGRELKRIEVGA
jgi:multidrug resistance protein, MATE family